MKSHQAEATIDAPPEAIWAILADAAGYADWDSGIVSIAGQIALGEQIKLTNEVNPGRAFALKVTEFAPNERMVWKGGVPLGLFTAVRTFTLAPADDGATSFAMREQFSGPLAPLMGRIMPDLQPSFDQFAAGLKSKAEAAG